MSHSLRLTEAEYQALLKRRSGQIPPAPPRGGTQHEDNLAAQLDALVIPYEREFRFLPDRKFRFDFVLLPLVMKLAVEIDGIVHRIDSRWRADREKGNLALAHGWRVIHLGVDQIRSGEGVTHISQALLRPAIRT